VFDNFFVGLLTFAFGLAVLSVTGIIVVHKLFWPNLPPGVQDLHRLLMSILIGSAKIILGPVELLRRMGGSIGQRRLPEPPSLPGKDIKPITRQSGPQVPEQMSDAY
jgi:hypothetical protein